MEALNLPRPAWMSEDLVLLEEQARRFMAAQLVPHVERWHENGIMDREVLASLSKALWAVSIPSAIAEQIHQCDPGHAVNRS